MPRREGYGQFCPVAIAAEVFAEKWTPLVLRELLMGSHRFNDIHRGVRLMSTSLLAQRLRELERTGLVQRRPLEGGAGHGYYLTDAGAALRPIIEGIGVWGMKYMRTLFDPNNLDPRYLMWDMRRCIRAERLPDGLVVIRIDLTDVRAELQHYWLVKRAGDEDVDLCFHDPGYEVDLVITSDIETLARMWIGDIGVDYALHSGRVALEGSAELRRGLVEWIGLSPMAHARRVAGV
jgi:DNA-binding HxlR family transcriptional regulator